MFILESLEWDTKHFGYPSYKIQLLDELSIEEIENINVKLKKKGFYTVKCNGSFQKNITWLSMNTNAILADINVQLVNKNMNGDVVCKKNIVIKNHIPFSAQIVDLIGRGFIYSRFLNDYHINKKKAFEVYTNWISNAFECEDKFFALYYSNDNIIMGVIMFSICDKKIVLELVCMDSNIQGQGVGSELLGNIYDFAKKNHINCIQVGTQLQNILALNFYIKNGFLINEMYYTFHLWVE